MVHILLGELQVIDLYEVKSNAIKCNQMQSNAIISLAHIDVDVDVDIKILKKKKKKKKVFLFFLRDQV